MQKSQIVLEEIKSRIESGIWRSGAMIPTEAELCSLFSVSRITIRKALEELAEKGYIKRIQGKGTFVSSNSVLNSGQSPLGFSQHMAEYGIAVSSRLVLAELIVPPYEIRKKLFLRDNENEVWHFRRLRFVLDRPIALMDSFIRKPIGDRMNEMEIGNSSFFELFEKITGEKIVETIGSVTAIIPEKDICDLMQVEYPSAQLLYKNTAYLESGTPIQFDHSIFNSRRYEFTVDLKDNPIVPISPISP